MRFQYPPLLLPRAAGELISPRDAWLPDGGVNGRNPPRFSAGEDWPREGWLKLRWLSVRIVPVLAGPELERAELPGALNERSEPDCVPMPREAGAELRFPKPLGSRFEIPALGRCIPLLAPRAVNSPLERPPAGIAPTWFCAIDCRRFEVCCWNDAGRAVLLCEP